MSRLFDKLKIKSSERKNNKTYGICECACGNIVKLDREELTNHTGCRQACLASRGEMCAADLFNEMDIQYQVQKKFEDFDLRFDFYLPEYNIIIECDGAQHFRSINNDGESNIKLQETRNRDERKQKYCAEHNITLFQIPFGDTSKLNKEYLKKVLNEISNSS